VSHRTRKRRGFQHHRRCRISNGNGVPAFDVASRRRLFTVRSKNFKLYSHITLTVRDDAGQVQEWKWLRSVAELKGHFKVYSLRD